MGKRNQTRAGTLRHDFRRGRSGRDVGAQPARGCAVARAHLSQPRADATRRIGAEAARAWPTEMKGAWAHGAQERTRTFTAVKPLAPEASASTNSATWARAGYYGSLARLSNSRKRGLFLEHDLFGKPAPTFLDHAQIVCTAR